MLREISPYPSRKPDGECNCADTLLLMWMRPVGEAHGRDAKQFVGASSASSALDERCVDRSTGSAEDNERLMDKGSTMRTSGEKLGIEHVAPAIRTLAGCHLESREKTETLAKSVCLCVGVFVCANCKLQTINDNKPANIQARTTRQNEK